MLLQLSALTAFLQGLLSFLSPCVLPLVPAYLAYLSSGAPEGAQGAKKRLLVGALLFVLGFSLVFVLLGATATGFGAFLSRYALQLRIASGGLVALFGLLMLFMPRFLQHDRRFLTKSNGSPLRSFLMGSAFAFGWSPCIGPSLASILVLAASHAAVWDGVLLLSLYSLGLALPFLLLALFMQQLSKPLAALRRHMRLLRALSAVILLVVGIMMMRGTFAQLAAWW